MRRLLIIILMLLCAACDGEQSATFTSENTSAQFRIINGLPQQLQNSPQIVSLRITYWSGDIALCTGTVIGPQEILTAGHCVEGAIWQMAVGTVNGDYPVESFARHPGYQVDETAGAVFNDVAVLKTPPLDLPTLPVLTSVAVTPGSELTVYGYGLDQSNTYGDLKFGSTFVDDVTDNHLFGPPFYGSGINPCSGDSGGPAVQTHDLEGQLTTGIVGLVSSGSTETCFDGDVTYYANLQNPEILSFIAEAAPSVIIR